MSRGYTSFKLKIKNYYGNSKDVALYDYDILDEYLDDVRRAGVVAWEIETLRLD